MDASAPSIACPDCGLTVVDGEITAGPTDYDCVTCTQADDAAVRRRFALRHKFDRALFGHVTGDLTSDVEKLRAAKAVSPGPAAPVFTPRTANRSIPGRPQPLDTAASLADDVQKLRAAKAVSSDAHQRPENPLAAPVGGPPAPASAPGTPGRPTLGHRPSRSQPGDAVAAVLTVIVVGLIVVALASPSTAVTIVGAVVIFFFIAGLGGTVAYGGHRPRRRR